MTDTAHSAQDPHDPHDHTGHDHPPTGAELVQDLVRWLSVLALVIPVLAVVLLVAVLPLAPSSPLVLLLGLALGAAQLVVVVATSIFVSRSRRRLASSPGLLAVRSAVEEALRVAAVLLALLLWPADARPELGAWLGAGAALVWIVLSTAQTVSTRRRIARPSQWSKEMIETMLTQRVGARATVVMRFLDVIGTACFQLGATVLVMISPVLAIATLVLSIASGLSTLVLRRKSPLLRPGSPWAFAPLAIGILTVLLALTGILAP